MGIFLLIGEHWFELLQSAGIVVGFFFTRKSLRDETKARCVTNLLELTKEHREIWTEFLHRPALRAIFEAKADLNANRVTREQELFIGFLILQLNASYQAMKSGVFISPTGLRKDIQGVFSYPLPKMVWEKMKPLQDADFVRFIETGFFKN